LAGLRWPASPDQVRVAFLSPMRTFRFRDRPLTEFTMQGYLGCARHRPSCRDTDRVVSQIASKRPAKSSHCHVLL
jgi:hypothetical protein